MTRADVVVAHGVVSREDLPLPFGYALTGGLIALAVSFVVAAFLWRTPHFSGPQAGRVLALRLGALLDSTALRWSLRAVGLVLVAFVAFAALAGPDVALNPTAGMVYVVFWVGLVPASLLFGPVWRVLNPLRTIHAALARVARVDPDRPPFALPTGLGYWPAAAGLFSFVWLELCAADRDSTHTLVTFFVLYAAFNLLGGLFFGRHWFDRCDGFEVFSTLLGRLSVFARRSDGALVLRNPLQNLDAVEVAPGLVAVLGVLLGSTGFDSISGTQWWIDLVYGSDLSPTLLNTVGLSVAIGVIAGAFWVASWLAGSLAVNGPAGFAGSFGHSLIPIAAGYLVAHYFSLLVFAGQQAVINASDPLVDGSNLFGTADWQVNYGVLSPKGIASVQVGMVVLGHILGVLAAHDRSMRLLPKRDAVIGQLPMMVLMIGYTLGGLSLLQAN